MSKIRSSYDLLRSDPTYSGTLKFFKKGTFFVAVEEEAFAVSERYGVELTKLAAGTLKA
jgi:hypothetical protein